MKAKISDLKISPYNVRNVSDILSQDMGVDFEASIALLAEDIRANGLINKIVLTKGEDGLEIVAGSRRRQALETIHGPDYILQDNEYVVRDLDGLQSLRISISENQQRYDLTPLELCNAIKRLEEVSPGMEPAELAKTLGLTMARFKRLVDLEKDIRKGKVPEKALKELNKKPNQKPSLDDKQWSKVRDESPDVIETVVDAVVDGGVPAGEVGKLVKKERRKQAEKDADTMKFDAPSKNENEEGVKSTGSGELDVDIKYHYKGQLRMVEEAGKFRLFVMDDKTGEQKIDMRAFLEYLRQPGKFRCDVNFRMKVVPLG